MGVKAALSGPPSVCRRVRDPCVLRYISALGAWPDRQSPGPAARCGGLALLLWRAWGNTTTTTPASSGLGGGRGGGGDERRLFKFELESVCWLLVLF